MDPTQQEGQNPENVGAGRQAIFTPPPPEPTTPDANSGDANAQPTPSVNLAHPYFSNHPTQTSATETGDIILNSNSPKPKQNKRPFIIGGVILVAVIAIIAIAMWLVPQGVKDSRVETIEETFNRFANYYLFNEESDKPLEGEWDRDRSYAAEEAILNDDKDFFQRAKTYFDRYKTLYDKQNAQQEGEDNSVDASYVEAYADAFNFLYLFSQTDFFDDSELLQLYVSSGAATAYEIINNRYNALANTDYQLQKDFAEGRILYDSAQIDRLEIYAQSGCLADDGSFIDNGCEVDLSNFDITRIEQSYDVSDLLFVPQDVVRDTTRMLYIMANQGLYK